MNKFYLAMGIAFLIDIIIYSLYPVFNNSVPSIGGLTNFYSYQIILLVVSTALFAGVVLAVKDNGSGR
ncbi:hypothetical protein DFR87_11240 [Metallosphaera hakonensis JCM 8857 = DSM 7519]|uniref:Uncharacterized protein n=1 Tax=Metallosphaera hakonensis JCM 8857 = DSM 7519 TaxID=1293036 RepID=A0A2U9IVY0_9CREN|nr:hypothetical protein DFR87_11240 [Metallosphaera hakonensis JCM 8857 = DSM 7519]